MEALVSNIFLSIKNKQKKPQGGPPPWIPPEQG